MVSKYPWLMMALVAVGCAPRGQKSLRIEPEASAGADARQWVPETGAGEALERVLSAAAFGATPHDLSVASGGRVGSVFRQELLSVDVRVQVDQAGRSRTTRRAIWRVLNDSPDQTETEQWSPWRQERPQVRARVVSAAGQERWLDVSTIVEEQGSGGGVMLSDVRKLQVPLPGARRGSVVEYESVVVATRAPLEGLGVSGRWWLSSPFPVRHQRFSVEVPEASPLAVHVIGVPKPEVTRGNGSKRVDLEVKELDFKPFLLTRDEVQARRPSFAWSTVPGWNEVVKTYAPLLNEGLSDPFDLAGLDSKLKAAPSVEAKTQLAMRWVSERVRYTAVHLGKGALTPTRPSAVLARGYGDCKDLSVLLTAVLRSAGVDADVALVSTSSARPLDEIAGIENFNHAIVAVKLPGQQKPLWVDPTAPEFPVGTVPESVRDQRALVVNARGGLVATPTRAETTSRILETLTYEFAPFGVGAAKLSAEYFGEAEAIMRAQSKACDAAAAHALAGPTMGNVFGESTFEATLAHCKPGEGPVLISATASRAETLDTGDQSVTVKFPSMIAGLLLDRSIIGAAPNSDERTPEQREEARKRQLETFGRTDQELERATKSLDSAVTVERVYRVRLPAHFAVANLPPRREQTMGPARWTEEVREVKPGEAEVRFQFHSAKVDWSADDVAAFRAAFWKRFQEPMPSLKFVFEPARLLSENHGAEAMTLARKLLEQRPSDAVTRARYARLLLTIGLGDLADVEAERAFRDAPNEPFVLAVRGDTARSNPHGLLYTEPFDRATALASFSKAHELLPTHSWITKALVRTLRTTADGSLETRWTPEVVKAAGLLEEQVAHNRAGNEDLDSLVDLYSRARRRDDLKQLFEKSKALREKTEPTAIALRDSVTSTPAQTLQRLARITDPKVRFEQLAFVIAAFAHFRRHADAAALLDGYEPGAMQQQFKALQVLRQMLKPVPDRVDLSTPEAGARSVLAVMANAGSEAEAAQRLAQLASKSATTEFGGSASVFRFARVPSMHDSTFSYEYLFHRGECTVAAKGSVARVKCVVPENRALTVTSYWSKSGSTWQLESLGKPSQLATCAWTARERQPTEAALWVDWTLDEMQARQANDGHTGNSLTLALLKNTWTRARREDPAALTFAAASTFFFFSDVMAEAPPEAVEAFRKELTGLSGSSKRDATRVLVSVLSARRQPVRAAEALRPLAESENEPELWQRLASLEVAAGNDAAADELVRTALQRSPDDASWRVHQGFLLLEQARWKDALEVLRRLRAEKSDAVNVQNNLLWAMVMAGVVDEAAEREATALTSSKDVSAANLSTAAHVLMERGRLDDAATLLTRRAQRNDTDVDDAQWLARGRLLQLLGFAEEANKAFARIDRQSRELVAASKRYASAPAPR